MEKITKAIIMAAGYGSRLAPVTNSIPKPLIKVNGERIIDTIIDALIANNIKKIYIVVGYLKEEFNILLKKYPVVKFIENPYYDSCNNISSLFVARKFLGNSVILDGDQIIKNAAILNPLVEYSSYCCSWTDDFDNREWILTLNSNDEIESCNRNGGQAGWQLHSVSFWNNKDGEQLKSDLEQAFITNKKLYWDDVPIFLYKDHYDLHVRKISKDDLTEIDTLSELQAIDGSYRDL